MHYLQCAGNRREDLHDAEKGIFIAPHCELLVPFRVGNREESACAMS
jgi:hypothetical protein